MTDAGTVISGINGAASLDSASLVVGTGNVSKTQDLAGSTSMIQFDADGTQLEIETLTLTLSADLINAMQGENVLGKIDSQTDNLHDFPFRAY